MLPIEPPLRAEVSRLLPASNRVWNPLLEGLGLGLGLGSRDMLGGIEDGMEEEMEKEMEDDI